MDLDNLKNQVSNLTLYDLKAGFRKAQNAVMNYTEMEAKVREATNNEPWGCPTSVMQEIANGTFNYATLNEVMPMIYKRFTEKAAEEWRQIYKALQLLEFLIKNGSERVVDDARSHMSLLKMLRQFHYIDQNGKDQGINVRNRAKELAELLGDVERIRSERKKARTTRNKYGGVEGGIGIGGSSSRYGGFGGESSAASGTYGGYSGGVYGDGGGFGGQSDEFGETSTRRTRYEEYDEYDEGTGAASSRRRPGAASTSRVTSTKAEPPKPKEPEVDLFDFGDDDIAAPALVSNGNQQTSYSGAADDFGEMRSATTADDDFDDFQSATTTAATTSSAQFASPVPPPGQGSNMNMLAGTISPPPSSNTAMNANYSAFKAPAPQQTPNYMQPQVPQQQQQQMQAPKPSGYQAATPNYFGSISTAAPSPAPGAATTPSASSSGKPTSKPSTSNADPFASLMGGAKKTSNAPAKGPTMADMARQKASAGIWGTSTATTSQTQQQQQQQQGSGSGGGNDLLGL